MEICPNEFYIITIFTTTMLSDFVNFTRKVIKVKRVIVTGAAGFAGCNLVEVMVKRGFFVFAVVRNNSPHNCRLNENDNLKIVFCDMENYDNLPKMINEKCECFYHLAWQGDRYDFREQYKNIMYSIRAVEAAKKIGCKRFICTGSQAEYGIQSEVITELTFPQPVNAYGAAKLATNVLTKERAKEIGIEWIWGRIFSLYGKYEPLGRMLPDLLKALKKNEKFELSSAKQMWDYLYATECAEALIALSEYGHDGEVYNIANGNYRSLRDYVEIVRNVINSKSEIVYGKNPGQSLKASVEKIYRDTGWSAGMDFADGIRLMDSYSSVF